jgi:aspartyl-tRNA(Asn)/glutamyl-tRNA(Gln) amidotransferase subunit B
MKAKINAKEFELEDKKVIKLAANYIITELRKYLIDNNQKIENLKITSENFGEFICIVGCGQINSSAAQVVLKEMYETGGDPSQIIEAKDLAQMNDGEEMEKIIEKLLKENQQSIEDYKNGKKKAFQFLIGQAMKITKGKANPQKVAEIIKKKIT